MRAPLTSIAVASALLVAGCSAADAPADQTADAPAGAATAPKAKTNKDDFELLPAQYAWSGSGKRDDVFQPHFALSVPETDDIVWSSQCLPGGKVQTQLYFAPPEGFSGGRIGIRFETDRSKKPLQYTARYSADGQFDGFELTQSVNDPMFDAMRQGRVAYLQIGEGSKAVKMRIALKRADSALAAFLPACSAPATSAAKSAVRPAATVTSAAIRYACEDGRTVVATYMGNDTDTPIVRLDLAGAVYLLPQSVSGSGARYASSDALNDGLWRSWHTKAADALLTEANSQDLDGPGSETVSCREKQAP